MHDRQKDMSTVIAKTSLTIFTFTAIGVVKPDANREKFFEELGSDDVRGAATRLLDAAEASGGRLSWGRTERLDSGNLR